MKQNPDKIHLLCLYITCQHHYLVLPLLDVQADRRRNDTLHHAQETYAPDLTLLIPLYTSVALVLVPELIGTVRTANVSFNIPTTSGLYIRMR
jgi:hypothetical protein